LHIANKLLRIALLVKLAIKTTDNNDMHNREFSDGSFLFFFSRKMRLPRGKFSLDFLAVPAGKDGRVVGEVYLIFVGAIL